MTRHRGRLVSWFVGILVAVAIGGCQDGAAPGPDVTVGPLTKRGGGSGGGGGSEVLVEFKRPASAELESFFRPGVTLDLASSAQTMNGQISGSSINTKMSPFRLILEPSAEFYDDKDPRSDPVCPTEWLEAILDAATANGGWLDGSLEIKAWSRGTGDLGVGLSFIVPIDPDEYLIQVGGIYGRQEDRLIQANAERTVLAMRDGYPRVYRRELGPHAGTLGGTWSGNQRCLQNADKSNGFVDFEIWVSKQ